MKHFLSFLLLLATPAFAVDTVVDGYRGERFLVTPGGNRYMVNACYTTDGSSNAVPIMGSTGGTVTANQGAAGAAAWLVDGSGVTQPISAAALPLPSGASTAAKQPALGTAGTPSADVITVQGITSMTALKVDGSGVTQPVSGSVTVSGLPVSPGRASVGLARDVYTTTPITTAAYVELVASTADAVNELFIFDSSGQTLVLAVGAAASEVDKLYIVPGGNGLVPLAIPTGTRISAKAVSANATAGELNISFLK